MARVAVLRVYGPEVDGVREHLGFYQISVGTRENWRWWYGGIRDTAGPDGMIHAYSGTTDAEGNLLSVSPSPWTLRG